MGGNEEDQTVRSTQQGSDTRPGLSPASEEGTRRPAEKLVSNERLDLHGKSWQMLNRGLHLSRLSCS